MRYLVTLTPLEPFLFGGENTFGKLGSENEGTYLVHSMKFPQQSALLGMLRKEIMTQSQTLTRKVKGEWVDQDKKQKATDLVGNTKFDIAQQTAQNFGVIKKIEPVFLLHGTQRYIKKVNNDDYEYKEGVLKKKTSKDKKDIYFTGKDNIYDNFVEINSNKRLSQKDIFEPIEQIGNKKNGGDNALFKKTSFLLKQNFQFAFYLECDYKLKNSIVTVGADKSSFKFEVREDSACLNYYDANNYLTLLSDSYITTPLQENCTFAITSEISYRTLKNKKHVTRHNRFERTPQIYLYEKGSIIIEPSEQLLQNLNNQNCQKIGYNTYTYKGSNK